MLLEGSLLCSLECVSDPCLKLD